MSLLSYFLLLPLKLKDWQLNSFIEHYLKERKVSIDNKSTQIIADHIGSDLHRLASELNKLTLSMGEKDRTVTPELVEQKIGVSKDFNSFELKIPRVINAFVIDTETCVITVAKKSTSAIISRIFF